MLTVHYADGAVETVPASYDRISAMADAIVAIGVEGLGTMVNIPKHAVSAAALPNIVHWRLPHLWIAKKQDTLLKELQSYEADDGSRLSKVERVNRSKRLVRLMKRFFGHKCIFCGGCIETGSTPYVEVHHVHELGKGGSDAPSNIAVVCPNHHQTFHHGKTELVNLLKDWFTTLNPFFETSARFSQ